MTQPPDEGDRPSVIDAQKTKNKTVLEALDRMVEPLDAILGMLSKTVHDQSRVLAAMNQVLASQRRNALISTVVAFLLVATVSYELHLANRLSALEEHLIMVGKTSEDTRGKVAEAEKKIDEVKTESVKSDKKLEEAADIALKKIGFDAASVRSACVCPESNNASAPGASASAPDASASSPTIFIGPPPPVASYEE